MMTLEEYTKEVKKEIRSRLKAEPRKELEKYIMTLEKRGKIKASYEEDTDPEIAEITGEEPEPNPRAFAHSIFMMYPYLP